jgi:hypothetical protein
VSRLRLPALLGALLLAGIFLYLGFGPLGLVDTLRYGFHDPHTSWASYLSPGEARLFGGFLLAGGLLALLLACGPLRGVGRMLERLAERLAGPRGRLWGDAGLFLVTCLLVATVGGSALQGMPLADDEWVYLFQAQLIAGGHLTMPTPPLGEHLRNQFLVVTDRMYGQYPFGHPALLAAGVLLGRPRLVPVALSGLTVVLVRRLGLLLGGPLAGLLAALLLLASPQFLLTGATLLSQVSMLFLAVLAVLLLAESRRRDRVAPLFAAAALWGLGFQLRGIETVILGLPFAALLLRDAAARRPFPWRCLAVPALGAGLAISLYLLINWIVNGGPLTTNYNPLWKDDPSGARLALGFGPYPWGLVHTPAKGLLHAAVNAVRINFWCLGWPLSWAAPLLWLRARRGKQPEEWALATLIPLTFLVYFFYFWPGNRETGPIFYHLLLLPFSLLGGLALGASPRPPRPPRAPRVPPLPLAVGGSLAGLLLFLPLQWSGVRTVTDRIARPYRLLERKRIHNAVVFTPLHAYVMPDGRVDTPLFSMRNNSPSMDDDILFARIRGKSDHEFLARFPGRKGYRLVRIRDGRFRVLPLPPPNESPPGDARSGAGEIRGVSHR